MKHFYVGPADIDEFTSRLLTSWHNILGEYEAKWKQVWTKEEGWPLPYVFDEKPQVGLLATAAIRIGSFPFIEFERRRGTKRGRQDLEIVSDDNQIWNIEAKLLAIPFNDRGLEREVKRSLNYAVRAVKLLKNGSIGRRVGIVFVVPNTVEKDSECDAFAKRLMHIINSLKHGFAAIHFCRSEIWRRSDHKDCPGVGIVGQYVH